MPLWWYNPGSVYIFILLAAYLLLAAAYLKGPKILKWPCLVLGLAIFAWGCLLTGKILHWPFKFDSNQTIFSLDTISNSVLQHQQDALYLPYRLRLMVYNNTVYIRYFVVNLLGLFTLQRFYDAIYLANIYPLIIGFGMFLTHKKTDLTRLITFSLGAGLIAIGINKSTDPYLSLYFLLPLILYWVALGLRKINYYVYLGLWLLTIIMITAPRI